MHVRCMSDVAKVLEGLGKVLGNRGEVGRVLEAFTVTFRDLGVANLVKTHLVETPAHTWSVSSPLFP
jgi:hypothetical protein